MGRFLRRSTCGRPWSMNFGDLHVGSSLALNIDEDRWTRWAVTIAQMALAVIAQGWWVAKICWETHKWWASKHVVLLVYDITVAIVRDTSVLHVCHVVFKSTVSRWPVSIAIPSLKEHRTESPTTKSFGSQPCYRARFPIPQSPWRLPQRQRRSSTWNKLNWKGSLRRWFFTKKMN